MKKLFFLFAVALSSLLQAQTNQVVWLNGKVYYEQPIATIDSITYDMNNMIEGDTLKLILPRASKEIVYQEVIKEVHDTVHVAVHDTVYLYKSPCDYDSTALTGVFYVGEKQVTFSRGNLQYTQSTRSWSFAENQYDILGAANISDSILADKIDLFGWSSDTGQAMGGVGTQGDASEYRGNFSEWGKTDISGYAPGTFRTLTQEEWNYILDFRSEYKEKRGVACIRLSDTDSVNGLILLPDDWTCPDSITFKSGFADDDSAEAYAAYQTFSLAQWQKLETAGAVFLPAAGVRYKAVVYGVQNGCFYWSATAKNIADAYCLTFNAHTADAGGYFGDSENGYRPRYQGGAVRLVRDLR